MTVTFTSPGRKRVCEEPHHRISQARSQILAAVVLVQQVGPIPAVASKQQGSVMVTHMFNIAMQIDMYLALAKIARMPFLQGTT